MLLIAHRALFEGPDPERENSPEQIERALDSGFAAEIDARLVEGQWWLGHDGPTYRVDARFLQQRGLWVHAKNIEALHALTREGVNTFWHDTDEYVLTRSGHIWAYPGKTLTEHCICVQPEWDENWRERVRDLTCYGVCSKFVRDIFRIRQRGF